MKIYLDSAKKENITEIINFYPIAGITTNPTIITKENTNYLELLKSLDKVVGQKDFHIQLTATTYEELLLEAYALKKLIKSNLYIKIPVSRSGYKAMSTLSNQGYLITATAITSVGQGVVASLSGAKYLAVYINRIFENGGDGLKVVSDLYSILKKHQLGCSIIGASYKTVSQINDSLVQGCSAVTIPYNLFCSYIDSPMTNDSIKTFTKQIIATYGSTGINLLRK